MHSLRTQIRSLVVFALVAMLTGSASAQLEGIAENLTLPTVSPGASVTQEVGISTITITYHRPGVKGREIWGTQLAPYDGKPFPWRAGANENTTFSISHDATINGKPLAAGTYGFHTIPTENDWTLIFSKDNASWGSYFYNPENDALRVSVTPTTAQHREWLAYGFENLTPTSADAYLQWEKKKVSFTVAFDVHEIVLESMRTELKSLAGFTWQGPFQAARYCLQNNINHEEALEWINQSIERQQNHSNLRLKGELLAQMGREDEARVVLGEALTVAPPQGRARIQAVLNDLN